MKTFLGTTIPAGTDGPNSLRLALDAIFAHPNVAPFVSKQLIQHLVTSNPAPAYVARIAAVFENNGSGVRGDLRAVVRAILLDVEARSEAIAGAASFGKLREPINRLTGWARAFNATSASGAWSDRRHQLDLEPARPEPRPEPKRLQLLPPRLHAAQQRDRHRRAGRAGIPDRQRAVGDRLCQLYGAAWCRRTRDFRANYADMVALATDGAGSGQRGRHPARRAAFRRDQGDDPRRGRRDLRRRRRTARRTASTPRCC